MVISGIHGQVEIADTSPAVVLANLNKWSLNMGRDYAEVTSFGASNKSYVPLLPDISGSLGGFYNLGEGSPATGGNLALFEAAEGSEPVTLNMIPNTQDASHYWTGLAYIDVSIDVAVNGAVTISGNFKGAGDWQRN